MNVEKGGKTRAGDELVRRSQAEVGGFGRMEWLAQLVQAFRRNAVASVAEGDTGLAIGGKLCQYHW